MRLRGEQLALSATDLSSFFECGHKTVLDLRVAEKELQRPGQSEIERRMLQERGRRHEQRVLSYYEEQGLEPRTIATGPIGERGDELAAATLDAMREGVAVIYQGVLKSGDWVGLPDFLVRRESRERVDNDLGGHVYEPVDAKLAREEKARAVIQLCAYADQLEAIQGALPEQIWLALGKEDVAPQALRTADFISYFRRAKRDFEAFVADDERTEPYPEPVEYCDVCEWWQRCEKRRRDDDHLSLVAGITRRQRARLEVQGVQTLAELATLAETAKVQGVEPAPLGKIRQQARLQEQARTSGKALYELVTDGDPKTGLELLPVPKPGDLFLDLEGDAFVQDGGLEYLFGLVELGQPSFDFVSREAPGAPNYLCYWATNRAEEKAAFEAVMARIQRGLEEFSDLHIYHYGHRENEALKTLSCRHATCEAEVDHLLRRGTLVNLQTVVRQGVRACVESYSLKELERLHQFERRVPVRDAAKAMQLFGWWLETQDPDLPVDELKETLRQYNQEDCLSTWKLRDWLEDRRPELEAQLGRGIGRFETEEKEEQDSDERNAEAQAVAKRLLSGLSADPTEDSPEQRARRLLADLLGWHWRELKSGYWEYFQAKDVPPSEWLENRFVLAGLQYEGVVDVIKKSNVHRYSFPEQEHGLRSSGDAEDIGHDGKSVKIHALGPDFIDIKRGQKSKAPHPQALRPGKPISTAKQEEQLLAVARSVADRGMDHREDYAAARDLLMRRPPRCGQEPGEDLVRAGENTVEAVKRLCLNLDRSVLAIQGPPGSGKTYRAAAAIVELVKAGKKVGVTANSHAVIVGLLKKAHEAAQKLGVVARIQHIDSPTKHENDPPPFEVGNSYASIADKLKNRELDVVGGTAFAWTNDNLEHSVDVLLVDEAGQMSLANALAVSTAAQSLVLLGDPAQLEQPQKGVHPPGAEVSALEHVLGEATTMPASLGVFLPQTRRLHPDICEFTSSVFYEGRLEAMEGLEHQRIIGPQPFNGSGLRYVSVAHQGNTNQSDEEVDAIGGVVDALLTGGARYVDRAGAERDLTEKDILVVAPYNAQVAALKQRLDSEILVGTVDKFQGKEAPVVIYSMTTSSGDEAPRGLEFLFSLNRLNVATSRAQAMVIVVASPELTKARCRTPRQLRLVNGVCGYLERVGEG